MFNARTETTPGDKVRFTGSNGPFHGEVIGFDDPLVLVQFTHEANKDRSATVKTHGAYHPDYLEKEVPSAPAAVAADASVIAPTKRRSSRPEQTPE